jgi:hypothetical protein
VPFAPVAKENRHYHDAVNSFEIPPSELAYGQGTQEFIMIKNDNINMELYFTKVESHDRGSAGRKGSQTY